MIKCFTVFEISHEMINLQAFLSISNKIAELDVESLTNLVTRDVRGRAQRVD